MNACRHSNRQSALASKRCVQTLITVVTLALFVSSPAMAQRQSGLEDLPGHDRYQEITRATRGLRNAATIRSPRWDLDDNALWFTFDNERWRLDLNTMVVEAGEEEEADDGDQRQRRGRPRRGRQRAEELSPDGNWTAVCRAWNVVLKRNDELGGEIAVTRGGERKHRYGQASWVYGEELGQSEAMWWSPDSTTLVFYEFDERQVPDFYLPSGWTELRTELNIEGYPKPGEPNPLASLHIYNIETRETIRADVNVDEEHYIYAVRFTPDGNGLVVNRTNRHQNILEVLAVDLDTGESRQILREQQETWQNNRPAMRFLEDDRRFIWTTERSGFAHYELHDLHDGKLGTLTSGDYPVGAIEDINEETGVIHYLAFSDTNPISAQVHRTRLDGNEDVRLTRDGMHHNLVSVSPDGNWFISRYQALGTPPQTGLFDSTGTEVSVLASADTEDLDLLGIPEPELFHFTANDGATDIYGWIYKPSDFDPEKSYPLVIDVYGGPLSQGVRNSYRPAYPQTEFGFIVAKIENRGTRGRGKAFEGATYMKLGEVDLQDQVDGVNHLIATRPYIDGNRVGIFGHSYGGYMSALAILKHPDVFHVSVAGAPVTDWRNYDTIYTERFMRTPQENSEGYEQGSCMTFVDQLEGKLLLLHGLVDDNVHPNNTWQLVDALQKAGKAFDLKIWPNSAHGLGAGSSAERWKYLHRHLVAGE